ncbi:unnamed protein product [Calicophoron daubneyi]|uniref:Tetratricopeptide repeat protein 39B n=1 Tax=Calicophoron daubneyi TaxID=300641 RepID=A0AAV2TJ62_CALDB
MMTTSTNVSKNETMPSTQSNPYSHKALIEGISSAKKTVDLFLNNYFAAAKAQLDKCKEHGMYPELAHSTILFIQGAGTNEREHLLEAIEHIRQTLIVCNASRRKSGFKESISKAINSRRRAIFNSYTEEEAHAELCYAESLLELAFLSMLQDDKFSSLLRCSLKIRQCHKCYRVCWRILKYRNWEDGPSRSAFESGVRLGVGAFNLMISLLPKGVLKLLEFAGFSGDREFGLKQLRIAESMRDSIRAPLCALLLLGYDLYATQMLAFEEPEDITEARAILDYWRKVYPTSAIFLLLRGRLEAISGDLESAIASFNSSITQPSDWPHYRLVCYWELVWCHALRAEWMQAVRYTEKLACESRWSEASYRYMKAAFLLQYLDDPGADTPRPGDQKFFLEDGESFRDRKKMIEHVDKLLTDIPKLMQRFAGRSLPIEKIALRKSKRYFEQKRRLTLPALELMYIWNSFKMIQCQQDSIMTFLLLCENKINELVAQKDKTPNYHDEYCLALLLKGVCLRCRGQMFQASMCFEEVLQSDYKGYNLQSRLLFRMHEMAMKLKKYGEKNSIHGNIRKADSDNPLPVYPSGSQKEAEESDPDLKDINPIFPEFDNDDLGSDDGSFSSDEDEKNP